MSKPSGVSRLEKPGVWEWNHVRSSPSADPHSVRSVVAARRLLRPGARLCRELTWQSRSLRQEPSWVLALISAGTLKSGTMSLLLFLILLAVSGLIVGVLARLLLPGPDPMGIGGTIVVGLAGSFIAGLFSWFVLHRHGAGLVLSVLFSMLFLWLRRRSINRRRI